MICERNIPHISYWFIVETEPHGWWGVLQMVASTTQNMALSDTSFSLHCSMSLVVSAPLSEGTFALDVRSISFLGVFFNKTLYPFASILYHSSLYLRDRIFTYDLDSSLVKLTMLPSAIGVFSNSLLSLLLIGFLIVLWLLLSIYCRLHWSVSWQSPTCLFPCLWLVVEPLCWLPVMSRLLSTILCCCLSIDILNAVFYTMELVMGNSIKCSGLYHLWASSTF